MDGKKLAAGRADIDVIALFGFPPGRPVPYSLWCALFFSIPRVRLQLASIQAQGHAVAMTSGDLGAEWGDAVALDPSQAEDWLAKTNQPRMMARLKAKLRWGA